MNMKQAVLTYLVSTAVYLALDVLWLGLLAKDFFNRNLGHLMGSVNIKAAALVYILYTVGVMIFVIMPAFEKNSLLQAVYKGALFGFFVYMTYDFTNYAVIKGWPEIVVAVDIAWGVFVTAVVAAAGYLFSSWLFR